MISWLLVVDVLIAVAILLLGLIVIIRNPRLALHQVFLVFTVSLAGWIILNYFSNVTSMPYIQALVANRLTLFFPALVVASMLGFVAILVANKTYNKFALILLLLNGVNALFALTPLIVKNIAVQGQVFAITFGPLSTFYFGVVLLNILFVITTLLKGIHDSSGKQKAGLLIIFWSILGTVLVTLVTNVAIPLVASSFVLTNVGPLSVILIAFGFYYSIARHQLFDIRPVIARAAGYVLTIAALAAIYGVLVFSLTRLFFDFQPPLAFEVFVSVATGIAALSFHDFKKLFDRFTNSLFYQDAYDPEVLFDEYNKTLVSTIELNVLLRRSSDVIVKYLKSEYCVSLVYEKKIGMHKISGTEARQFSSEVIDSMQKYVPRMHQVIISADNLGSGHEVLQRVLHRNGISMLARLTTDVHSQDETFGYILLGPKKSGNAYSSQDNTVMETIANELTIALQNALRFEEIERFNETLQEEIEIATRKLKVSNRQLKKLNDNKDDFIGMASHQLRTPLTSAKGYISLVLDGDAGKINKNQRELLEQAFASSQRMVYLIADLLNVSRLKTGKFTVERGSTHLPQLVHDEMDQLKKAMAAHDIKLTFEAPKHFPVLQLDATKTRQVVMNFLDNALYYTPNGGHIKVELKELPKSVEFRVTDNGIGVPKEEQHNLFTKFYRAKNAQRARPDGTGLGLYMAQKVIVKQGGTIIFDSKEGKGSTFGFSFPKELPANSPTIPELAVAEK